MMKHLKSQRMNIGLSQAALAEKLNIHQTAISQWELGESMPRAGKLLELARVLDITVDELLGDKTA